MSMTRRALFRTFAAGILLGACGVPPTTPLDADLLVGTDQAVYSLNEDQAPIVALRHVGGPEVLITGCPEAPAATLERRWGGVWQQAASRGIICLGTQTTETVALGPGEVRTFTLVPWREGTYRVRILIGPSVAAPQRTVLSNEFQVQQ